MQPSSTASTAESAISDSSFTWFSREIEGEVVTGEIEGVFIEYVLAQKSSDDASIDEIGNEGPSESIVTNDGELGLSVVGLRVVRFSVGVTVVSSAVGLLDMTDASIASIVGSYVIGGFVLVGSPLPPTGFLPPTGLLNGRLSNPGAETVGVNVTAALVMGMVVVDFF